MLKILLYGIISLQFSICIISCNSKSKDKLIIGTWIPVTKNEITSRMKLKFFSNKIGIAEIKGEPPAPRDTVTYEIKDGGKLLIIKDKSGKIEELEILKLDNKNFTFKKGRDIVKFVRE